MVILECYMQNNLCSINLADKVDKNMFSWRPQEQNPWTFLLLCMHAIQSDGILCQRRGSCIDTRPISMMRNYRPEINTNDFHLWKLNLMMFISFHMCLLPFCWHNVTAITVITTHILWSVALFCLKPGFLSFITHEITFKTIDWQEL